jgi:APA family basic amino acid/polyamine antiporter
VANVAALTQPPADRRYPRALQVGGLLGCLALMCTLPVAGITAGAVVVLVGVAFRLLFRRRGGRTAAA